VVVSIHVRAVVVDASAPIVALGFSSVIVLGSFAIYLRRPKKLKVQPVKKTRK